MHPTPPPSRATYAVIRIGSKDGSTYRAEIGYGYEVGGVPYAGHRLRAGYWLYSSGSGAQTIVDRYPPDAPVEVAYDPADPASSFLEPGKTLSAWAVMAFGGFFVVAGVAVGVIAAFHRG